MHYRPATGFGFDDKDPLFCGGFAGVVGFGVAAAMGGEAARAGPAFATLVGVTDLGLIAADRPVLALGLLGERYCTAFPLSHTVASVRDEPAEVDRVAAGALPGEVVPRTVVVRTRLCDAPAVVETCGDFGATVFVGIAIRVLDRTDADDASDRTGSAGRAAAACVRFASVGLGMLACTHRSTPRGGRACDSVPRSISEVRLVGGFASAGAPPPTSEGAEAAASPGISTARTANRRRKETSRPTVHSLERGHPVTSPSPRSVSLMLGL